MSRIPINALALWITLALLVLCAQGTTINWYKNITTPNFRSSFQLGYASAGSVISAIVNPSNVDSKYEVLFFRPGFQQPQANPEQTLGPFTGASIVNSTNLTFSGSWRIEIRPQTSDFLFTVEFRVDDVSVGKYSGVASQQRIFIIYTATMGEYFITMSLSSSTVSDLGATLYGPFTTPTYSGGSIVGTYNTKTSYEKSISYKSSGNSYYYLILDGTKLFDTGPLLRLSFQSDIFQCPYGSDSADFNGVFPTCSTQVASSGFPCVSFNNVINRCETCFTGWIPNGLGICVQDTQCGDHQYYSFGKCYDAIQFCNDFEEFGGICHGCQVGYTLLNYENGTQRCDIEAPECGENQYLLGKKCMNFVEHCANFISSNGTCQKCELGFEVKANVCVVKEDPGKTCPIGQRAVNGICQLIDKKCIYYGSDNKCQICSDGYENRDGKCLFIICEKRQYNVHGFCSDVSPLCGQFDRIYGNCLTCVNPFYVLQLDGTCVQTLDPNANGIVVLDCQDGYYPRGDTCVQVSPLCNGYDKTNGHCRACQNPSQFFLENGVCVSIRGYCASQPRTFFKNGECVKVSPLCDEYNEDTGACLSCLDKTIFNAADGTCKYNEICKDRQYKLNDGSCGDVNPDCTTFNPSNGQCTGCIDGKELNVEVGGRSLCCRVGYYIQDQACIPFLKENCEKVNSRFGYCQKCKSGFDKGEGNYYGKCHPI